MQTLILYTILMGAATYLLTRAKVTEWLWSRYPDWLNNWLDCTACSGFWYGLGCAGLGAATNRPFLGLDPQAWPTFFVVGLFGMMVNPIVAAVHTYSWSVLSALTVAEGGDNWNSLSLIEEDENGSPLTGAQEDD